MARPASSDRPVEPSDVSLVVPVGGAATAWPRCARSLACLEPGPGEIIAVLDGPNEAAAAVATEIGAKKVVLEERSGPARARNLGAQAAGGDILLFVDADIEVPEDLVAKVAALLAHEGEPTAVIGSYDDTPGDPSFLSQYRNLLHHFVHQTGREEASTFWTGCGAVRRRPFLAVGGFDERYPEASVEDIELGSRLLRSGHGIRLVKELQVKHLKSWRLADMLSTDLFRRAIPWTELMLDDGGLVNDLNVKTRDRVSVLLAFVPLVVLPWVWSRPALVGIAALALALVPMLNLDFFLFLRRKRGTLFALGVLPFYWLYLLICGVGFGLGFLSHHLGRAA